MDAIKWSLEELIAVLSYGKEEKEFTLEDGSTEMGCSYEHILAKHALKYYLEKVCIR